MKILIIGNGFLGKRCAGEWSDAVVSDKMIYSVADVLELLEQHKPDAVLNAAGVVGKPNVDWCETHQAETIVGNTILPIYIAQACAQKNVYLLHMGTGCIFYGASPTGAPWNENDFGNPSAVYTRSKYAADLALSIMPNIGIARIRMPIDYISSPGNLIDKLVSFPQVIDVENSVTIVEDMIKVFYQLLEKRASGIFHVTNPGSIRHRDIMDLYKKFVNPNHSCEWITENDLVQNGLAKKLRSNNIMTSLNLPKFGITMRPIAEAMEDTMIKYAHNKKRNKFN